MQICVFAFNPKGRTAFYFFNHGGDFAGARQGTEQMDMICGATHDEGLAIEVGEDAAEVGVEFLTEGLVAKEGLAVFGGEDGVDEDLGEGLRHGLWIRNRFS